MRPTGLALIVVDVQRDFCPGGALAVKDGDKIVPKLNKVIGAAEAAGRPVYFTRDWHPPSHISFKRQGGVWPSHCVKDTPGAGFYSDLLIPRSATVISKGDKPRKEAYSGFQGTTLAKLLRSKGVDEIFVGGLATDYCVKETAIDALREGFNVDVMTDCVRAVNLKPGDGARALRTVRAKGAELTTSNAAIKRLAGAQHYSHHPGLSGQS